MSSSSSAHLKREELRDRIFQTHLAYLAHDDNPCKIDKLKALEGLIAEYLAIVPSREKFIIERVGDVLSHAVFNNHDFSAYKAATAFQSVEKYANNLLAQPWRKEYRNIKMYSGFFKHFIQSPLPNAHHIFEAMGYSIQNNLELELEEPVDPDPVRHVALDCLVAYVECQIMIQIFECVRAFECTWTEIHGVRQNYICSIDEATRILQQMKIAQKEESSNKNDHLLPPLAQPEQIIVTPENTGTIWTDTSPFESNSTQNILLNLENDIVGKTNDWSARSTTQAEHPTRRSKIQLDGLTISRSRRSPSWTEGLNSSSVFNFNLQDDDRTDRKASAKHNYLHYNWQSEGSDPFEVYGNFNTQPVPSIGSKTWNQPFSNVGVPNVPCRPPPIPGRHESWELIDHPIVPSPVYLPVMVPTPIVRAAPLIPAPPAFSSSASSSLVNPYLDYGQMNSRSLPRKMIELNDNAIQPNYAKLEKESYVADSGDILGFNDAINKPKWKSSASVFRPVEPIGDFSSKYYNQQPSLVPKFENLGLTDSMLKPKTLPNNRNQMGLSVGLPMESKTSDGRRNPFPVMNEDSKPRNQVADFSAFHSSLGEKISHNEETSSVGMKKRNSFYDNVPMIDSDIGLPSLTLCGNNTLISPSGDKNCHQASKNGYRNDSKCEYNKIPPVEKTKYPYRKIHSSNRISNEDKSSEVVTQEPKPLERWSCPYCTYNNDKSDRICEMCGRSKEPVVVEISPGGKQCPECTLVNEKDSTNCSACDMSLKDCATYI